MIFPDNIPVIPDTEEAILASLTVEITRRIYEGITEESFKYHNGDLCDFATYDGHPYYIMHGTHAYNARSKLLFTIMEIDGKQTMVVVESKHQSELHITTVTSSGQYTMSMSISGFENLTGTNLSDIFSKLKLYQCQLPYQTC